MDDTLCVNRVATKRPGPSPGQALHRSYGLANLLDMIAAWQERMRFRWELKQLAKDTPYLIEDIGLTKEQVEEEVAKLPFWQR